MLSILSAILGFAAPFLPELLKYFTRSQDNAHELAMMKLQLEAKAQEHLYRMEEINVQGTLLRRLSFTNLCPASVCSYWTLQRGRACPVGQCIRFFICLQ